MNNNDVPEIGYTCYYEPIPRPGDVPVDGNDPDAYEYFQPTEATVSVWSRDIQHGGPPAGLLMRALSRCAPDEGQHFTRVTTEILGPIGLGVNRVRSYLMRPGRQISLIGADLEVRLPDGTFRVAARSIAWRMRSGDTAAIANAPHPPMTPVDDLLKVHGVPGGSDIGVDWGTMGFIGTTIGARTSGRVGQTQALWIRPAIDLVGGEPITDLESIFTVLDVANGLGNSLRPDEWSWMNTDTTVHLIKPPRGPWLGIDADMPAGEHGFGATFGDLYDENGFLGRSAQTVLLQGR